MAQRHYMELDGGLIIKTDDASTWSEGKQLTAKEGKAKSMTYARERLLEIVEPGSTIYTVLRHVSRSGMQRRIDLYAINNGEPRYLSGYAATLLDMKLSREGGIVTNGCGMDMGFDLVYSLGRCLWPNGTDKPHGYRNGEPDSDGGYALKHQWL